MKHDKPAMARPGRPSLLGSFAFRLGATFALVAIVGAVATAVVVNAAFAARFDRFLADQQSTQLTAISDALSRSYTGDGMWDQQALEAVVPTLGDGTLQVITPDGQGVWGWDGDSMEWDDRWIEPSDTAGTQPETDQQPGWSEDGWESDDGHSGEQAPPTSEQPGPSGDGWDQDGGHSDVPTTQPPSDPDAGWDGGESGTQGHDEWGLAPSGQIRLESVVLVAATVPTTATSEPPAGPAQRIPIEVDGQVVGTALVRLPEATAMPEAVAFRAHVIRLLLLGGGLGSLLALSLGTVFAYRATRPVREITAAARALATGTRTVRLRARRHDEFGEIGLAFNAMADAVDGEEQLRQSFAAEVAHELRTPLTILRSQVEGLRVGVIQPTPEALTSLDEEVRRMTRLVADLQILSSADAAGFSLQRTPTDLRELVEEATREFAGLFEGSEVELDSRLQPAIVSLDRVRIGQVLANLLSNALKFTPEGGQVRVDLRTEAPWALLRVCDSGPGIPDDELPHVFDRFFRGRQARAAGSGIGLTVVRELVEAHDGTIEVSNEPGNGAAFTVRLPLHAAASADLTDRRAPARV